MAELKGTGEATVAVKSHKMNLSNAQDLLDVGRTLKAFIVKNNLSTQIGGKSYAHVDAWKFAGSCFGLTAIVNKPVRMHTSETMRITFSNITIQGKNGTYQKEVIIYYGYTSDEVGYDIATKGKTISRELVKPYFAYECDCEIIKITTGKVVGNGTGFCSNLEASKALFDEYSVNSTCQTRSIGKAYRNLLGYIMNEAGHESTPAEEVEEEHIVESIKSNSKKSSGKPTMDKSQTNRTLLKISNGEVTDISNIEEFFELTEEQTIAFETMLKSKSPK